MGKQWEPYVVKQGDHLDKIAFLRGCDADAIWSNAKNEEVAGKRKTGAMLHPGDVLFVPPEPGPALDVKKGTSNRYTASIPTVPVAVQLVLDPKGKRSAGNQPFEVHGVGAKVVTGTSEADGTVRFEAPILCREAEVRFPKLGVVMPVHIGDLDPIEERSGQIQRLRNLGFLELHGEVTDEQLTSAFCLFQRKKGKPVTGVADPATLEALASEHLS
ncbi:MAG: peptidoglycan-binding domain-containing protein [Polyangiaceae bacterium]